jgi:hypothetical protein
MLNIVKNNHKKFENKKKLPISNGVFPKLSFSSLLDPFSTRYFTKSAWPYNVAIEKMIIMCKIGINLPSTSMKSC